MLLFVRLFGEPWEFEVSVTPDEDHALTNFSGAIVGGVQHFGPNV